MEENELKQLFEAIKEKNPNMSLDELLYTVYLKLNGKVWK